MKRLPMIERAAESLGVQLVYRNNAGKPQRVSRKALEGILRAFGYDPEDGRGLEVRLRQERERAKCQLLEPVYTLWQDKPPSISIAVEPGLKESDFSFECLSEDGEALEIEHSFCIRGRSPERKGELRFRAPLATGYYHLHVCSPAGASEALLISAPRKCYGADDTPRQWGLFAPMYSLHAEQGSPSGTFTEFSRFGEWAARLGADFVGALPLTATFLSAPFEPSPYSPASRLFWSEFFIDVARAPDLVRSPKARSLLQRSATQRAVGQLRSQPLVDYKKEMEIKRRILGEISRSFFRQSGSRRDRFESWLSARPEAGDYAKFRAAGERYRSSWHGWPDLAKNGRLQASDYRQEDFQYHCYAQFLAQEQMNETLQTFRRNGVSLYLDLPVGVNSDSYDVWRNRQIFAASASCGAPPDLFFSKGQDWGFPPLDPRALRQSRYAYWRQMARFQLAHARILRLDHIMGLHRLYWVPHGLEARDGAYVHYNADDLYAILSVESHLNETVLIGENLGTVPEAVNERMKKHAIRGMHILQFHHHPRQPAVKLPKKDELTTFDTHDTPTFVAFVEGRDLKLREELGLLKRAQIPGERRNREKLMRAYARYLRARKLLKPEQASPRDLLEASLKLLGGSKADYVLVALEDLWLEPNAQNVPGTTTQHPNWRRKTRLTLEAIFGSEELRRLLVELSRAREQGVNRSRSPVLPKPSRGKQRRASTT